MWTIELIIIAVMIAFNSVFAAYEIALASVGLARLDTLVRERQRGAAAALRMKRNMEASLAVVQVAITLVGVTAAATGGAGAEEAIEPVLLNLGVSAARAQHTLPGCQDTTVQQFQSCSESDWLSKPGGYLAETA